MKLVNFYMLLARLNFFLKHSASQACLPHPHPHPKESKNGVELHMAGTGPLQNTVRNFPLLLII
jgi:hypothetical protein